MGWTLIFGTGKALEHRLAEIPWERVDAFVDNDDTKWGTEFCGRQIYPPAVLRNMNVARIYISTNKFFDEIYEQLVSEYQIPKQSVKGIHCLIASEGNEKMAGYVPVVEYVANALVSLGATAVYDALDGLRKYGVLSSYDHRLAAWRGTGRWSVVRDPRKNTPDTVLFVNPFCTMSVDELLKKLQDARKRWNASCVIVASGTWDDEGDAWMEKLDTCFSDIIVQPSPACMVVVIRKEQAEQARIFTVTHKTFRPVLWADQTAGYETVLAGARRDVACDSLGDNVGENISYLNAKINECTAIYWIWKHRTQDVVGFSHYRRYFLNRSDAPKKRRCILSADGARRYLQDVDILVAEPELYEWDCVAGGIHHTTQAEAFAYGWDLMRRVITRFQPKSLQPFDEVMHGFEMYPCNMFVTRWEIFDAYCSWLFSFLIPAAEEAEVSRFDAYSKRIIGFFAERMLTVWLVEHPELRIRMLPILLTEVEEVR